MNSSEKTDFVVLSEYEEYTGKNMSVDYIFDEFERQARRYNRALMEEREVCVR